MSDCIFCNTDDLDLIADTDLCFAIRDQTPVAPLHTLIIPRRCIATPFELNADEQRDLFALAYQCSAEIATSDPTVGGFNFGANIGVVAGQKIMHVHFHLIPRRSGDLGPPPALEN